MKTNVIGMLIGQNTFSKYTDTVVTSHILAVRPHNSGWSLGTTKIKVWFMGFCGERSERPPLWTLYIKKKISRNSICISGQYWETLFSYLTLFSHF